MKIDDIMIGSKKSKNGELLELIAWGRAELSRAGIDEAQEECERVLIKLFGCSRSGIYLEEHELTASGVRERFLTLIEKRVRRVPLAYLLKEADFWQETLYVDERCLIPRPETEILVEQVLKALGKDDKKNFSFLDIGTGSGAIAIAILRAFRNARGTLLDISGEALEVAGENLRRYRLEERAKLVEGDIFNFFGTRDSGLGTRNEDPTRGASPEGRVPVFDLIVSNPPYLSEKDWKEIQEELKFEPRKALDGGKDGLDFYRRIIAGAKDHLTSGGLLALEVGGQAGPPIPTGTAQSAVVRHAVKSRTSSSAERARFNKNRALRGLDAPSSQAETVSKWLHDAGYDNIQRFNDYLQVQRVVTARRHS
ncbi:MAG: peptide chain release factor N(5)-glutamine methyltransferase [Candidatus Omnitrophota bacterium]